MNEELQQGDDVHCSAFVFWHGSHMFEWYIDRTKTWSALRRSSSTKIASYKRYWKVSSHAFVLRQSARKMTQDARSELHKVKGQSTVLWAHNKAMCEEQES